MSSHDAQAAMLMRHAILRDWVSLEQQSKEALQAQLLEHILRCQLQDNRPRCPDTSLQTAALSCNATLSRPIHVTQAPATSSRKQHFISCMGGRLRARREGCT